jgi:type I restriction enzyme, S subunit
MSGTKGARIWRSDSLSKVLTKIIDYRGISVPKSETGIPLITARNVRDGTLDFSTNEFINAAAYAEWKSRGVPAPGDVLFTTEAPLGKVAPFPLIGEYAIGQRVVAMRPKTDVLDSGYLLQFLLSPIGQRRIDLFSTGSTAKGISSGQLHKIVIDYPELPLQQQTAALLSLWDTAIQKTEQLIGAKERLSKALMQRVFGPSAYPRLRLSEFTRRITRKNIEGNGHPLTISGAEGLVSQSRYFGKRIAAEQTEHYTLLKRGEFAYNKSYSAGYPLGAIKRLDGHDEGIVSTLYLCFALDESKAPLSDYFAYFCEAGGFNHQIYQVAQEGARNHGLLNVTAEDFFSMKMPVPPREVQERVVRALGAAHHELALLRDQLTALREQKRGLMQKLLTGQWRLPVQEEAN